MNKNVLIVNWGTETSIYVLRECVKLKGYKFYLASTLGVPGEIKKLFGDNRIVTTNPYDSVKLCEDVNEFIVTNKVNFDIVTTFFEMCVYQTAFLAEYLGIEKRLSLKSALKTSVNKYLMRLELEKAGLEQPRYFKFDNLLIKEAFIFFKQMKSVAIIKPVHSGHSYGVRYIEKKISFNGFKKLIDNAKKDYQRNYDEWMEYENVEKMEFLLEEFIDGKIYSFDGIVGGNRVDFIGSTEFELSTPPVMQQIGHTIPIYSLNLKQINAARDYVEEIIKTLNLEYCGFHCEIKFVKDKPLLIEIAGRLPGGIITNAYQNLSKYNIFDKFLSIFDKNEQTTPLKNKSFYTSETMRIIFSDKEMGIVKGSPDNVQKKEDNFVYKIRSRNEGSLVSEKNNPFGVWLCEIILRSKKMSAKELIGEREKIIKKLRIRVEKNRLLSIKYFFVKIRNNVRKVLVIKRINFKK